MILSHDDEGSGPAVVLLHSGVCDRRMWDDQVAALASSHRVIRPDLRGFGATPLPAERFSFAGDVVALLDHLQIERAAIVGSSFGGRVALEVAVTAGERVASLALLCPAFRGVPSTPRADAFDEEEDRLLTSGDVAGAVELNVSTWLGPEASAASRDLVRRMQAHAFEVQLAAEELDPGPEATRVDVDLALVSVPTLVVSGGLDLDHFQDIAQHVADSVAGARLEHLPWAAHLPSLERPSAINALLAEFLA
ncbi:MULTISPECIES: alpha/beta fold hydrolase [unclassified Nocardioides]|uniref:alpha/beta fold hydrolase n=1 Tax=unclassified Nocardioides TaxID=2615069 RepID=UPI0006F21E17|nr:MULTISPECIES: alpha/beta fold hydrolase [unclassified Nocardioides]KRA39500.1 alpha/beta hydrolase [Nocardioides sp. Root614]KRA93465.1 alpha/beta hydrolase [Nocardioides sp. Root682]